MWITSLSQNHSCVVSVLLEMYNCKNIVLLDILYGRQATSYKLSSGPLELNLCKLVSLGAILYLCAITIVNRGNLGPSV